MLGKIVWGKGWEELLELLAAHRAAVGPWQQALDAYGAGEAADAVSADPAGSRPLQQGPVCPP